MLFLFDNLDLINRGEKMKNELTTTTKISINPSEVVTPSEDIVSTITNSLSIPRDTLPASEDINLSLSLLPRELNLISPRLRDKFIAKTCVAISVGLFDGAVVYIWNSVIKELRFRVQSFGMEMIKNVLGDKKDDNFLDKITDAELLELSYQLNLISEQGFFYLNHCREMRNNASIAHPTEVEIDDRELITFISRCCKYGLSTDEVTKGIDMKTFIHVLENESTTSDNLSTLSDSIKNTFDLQQELIMKILHSNYVDGSSSTIKRKNSLELAKLLKPILTNKILTTFVEKHNHLKVVEDTSASVASRTFFESMGLLSNLNDAEKVAIFKKAITQLDNAHLGMNNFYNEPVFAERLFEISKQITPIPEIIIPEYVEIIFNCYLGNDYGVSNNAMSYYSDMLKNLTPKGIEFILEWIEQKDELISNALSVPWKRENLSSLIEYYAASSLLTGNQGNKLQSIRHKYSI